MSRIYGIGTQNAPAAGGTTWSNYSQGSIADPDINVTEVHSGLTSREDVLLWRSYIRSVGLQGELESLETGIRQEIENGLFRLEEASIGYPNQSSEWKELLDAFQVFLTLDTDALKRLLALAAMVVDFTAIPVSGADSVTVNFTNTTTVDTDLYPLDDLQLTYGWDFENDSVIDSTVSNPSNIYASAGSYDVRLVVTNQFADSEIETKPSYITVVSSNPWPNFPGWTEVDPNGVITVDNDKILNANWTINGAYNDLDHSILVDTGSGFWTGDFEIRLRFKIVDYAVSTTSPMYFGITESQTTNNDLGAFPEWGVFGRCFDAGNQNRSDLIEYANLVNSSVTTGSYGNYENTDVYIKLVRDTNATKQHIYHYSDSNFTNLIASGVGDDVLDSSHAYRYIYLMLPYGQVSGQIGYFEMQLISTTPNPFV